MPDAPASCPTKGSNRGHFREISHRAVKRLFLRRWFQTLGSTALILYTSAALLALAAWLCGARINYLLAGLALVSAWLALAAVWSWLRRPSPLAALACWDEFAGRKEMFVSAYCFESQPHSDDGEQLHVHLAVKRLRQDAGSLNRDLPAPLAHRAWMTPLAFLLLAGLLPAPSTSAEGPGVDRAAQDRAKEVAEALQEQIDLNKQEEGLTEEEKEELKQLEKEVREALDNLRELDNQSQREVLAELEEQAHAAEQLAAELDSAANQQLSSKMLEELARHVDTTDFASAMQAMDLQKGSQEARNLSKKLDDQDLPLEQQKRIETALDEALKVANDEDKQNLVGKKLEEANKELAQEKPKEAATDFKELSEQLDQARQRQMAKERLEQLAEQLRNSGQKIFGQKPSNIQRLAQVEQGLQQLGAQQLQDMQNLPMLDQPLGDQPLAPMAPPTPGAPQAATPNLPAALGPAPIPGSLPGDFGPPLPGGLPAPVPGTGQGEGFGQGQGQGQGQGLGQGLGQGQGQGLGQGQGNSPVPGLGAGNGGLMAGHGSAGYGNQKTNPLDSQSTGTVNAAVSGEGPSQVRDVEPQGHREETGRKSKQLAIDFIKTEEAALADEPLPLSRREQVLRYFTALRRRLVDNQSNEQPSP